MCEQNANVVRATCNLLQKLESLDFSFEVESEAIPPFDGPDIVRTAAVRKYTRTYEFDARSLSEHLDAPDRAVFVAILDDSPVGLIAIGKAPYQWASIAEFAVQRASRRKGIGQLLMDEAAAWARTMKLGGIQVETQVRSLAACRFYARYGFRLGGFDSLLYRTVEGSNAETALFWYLMLQHG